MATSISDSLARLSLFTFISTPRCPQRLPHSSPLPRKLSRRSQRSRSPTRRENAYQAISLPNGSRSYYPVPCFLCRRSGDHRSTIGDNTSSRGTMYPDQLDSELRCKSETRRLIIRMLIALQIPCLISAGSAAGCSNPLDLACQCKAGPQIRSLAAPCVKSKCSPDLGSSLDSVADAICTECV